MTRLDTYQRVLAAIPAESPVLATNEERAGATFVRETHAGLITSVVEHSRALRPRMVPLQRAEPDAFLPGATPGSDRKEA